MLFVKKIISHRICYCLRPAHRVKGSSALSQHLLAPPTLVAPSYSHPGHFQPRGRHWPSASEGSNQPQGQYACLLIALNGAREPQGPVFGLKKLARHLISSDLDRSDKTETALVKTAPTEGRPALDISRNHECGQ